MKKYIILSCAMLLLLVAPASMAQFSFGNNSLLIKSGALVTLDGLTIAPETDLALSNKTLQLSHTAIPGFPANSIQRVYSFNEPFQFTGTLGIFYLPSELNGNTEASLQIASSGVVGGGYVTSSGSTVEPGNHYIFNRLTNTDIRIVSAVEAGSVLPVTLISFTAKKENRTALLQWSTSFETNSDFFEIQHSLDGQNWHAIGRVTASGESKSIHHYAFTDVNPLVGGPANGGNLYRLKMADRDDTFTYSQIRSLRFENLMEIKLFPNPVADKLEIKVSDWNNTQQVQIINARGATVYESTGSQLEGIPANGINVRDLPTGHYIVKITDKNGYAHSAKMVKY